MTHDIPGIEHRSAVNADVLPSTDAPTANCDLLVAPIPINEPPQGGRREVTQDRVLANGLDGSQEVPFPRDRRVPDGVHRPIQRVQPPRPTSAPYCLSIQPALSQLV